MSRQNGLRGLLSLMALSLPALGSAQESANRASFTAVRQEIIRAVSGGRVASAAVAVAKDGLIVWEEGFGWADRARSIAASPHTSYSAASITKVITATALMTLVEEGRVDLDRPANAYLPPEARISGLAAPDSLATVRRLLVHTAGLPKHWRFFYHGDSHRRPPLDEVIRQYGSIIFVPDEPNYSNLGYAVLERIIERVSGQPFATYVRDKILAPLGMKNSAVAGDHPPHMEHAIRYGDGQDALAHYDMDHRGASALWTSAHDLVRFGMYHFGGPTPDHDRILSPAGLLQMKEPLVTVSPGVQQAIGWFKRLEQGRTLFYYSGGMPGVSAALVVQPDERVVVALMANQTDVPVLPLARTIAFSAIEGGPGQRGASSAASDSDPDTRLEACLLSSAVGTWRGAVRTYQGDIPIEVTINEEGGGIGRLGDGDVARLSNVRCEQSFLAAALNATLATADAAEHPHAIDLLLRQSDSNELQGQLTAITRGSPAYFALSHYVTLTRMK